MDENSLESLAKRVELLELALGTTRNAAAKDWRKSVGMFRGRDAIREIVAEGAAIRKAERLTAQNEN